MGFWANQCWAQMDSAPEVPAEDGPIGKIRAFFDNAAWQDDVFPLLSSWEGVLFIFLFCSQFRLLRLWTWVTTCFKNVPSRPKWPRWDASMFSDRYLSFVACSLSCLSLAFLSVLSIWRWSMSWWLQEPHLFRAESRPHWFPPRMKAAFGWP